MGNGSGGGKDAQGLITSMVELSTLSTNLLFMKRPVSKLVCQRVSPLPLPPLMKGYELTFPLYAGVSNSYVKVGIVERDGWMNDEAEFKCEGMWSKFVVMRSLRVRMQTDTRDGNYFARSGTCSGELLIAMKKYLGCIQVSDPRTYLGYQVRRYHRHLDRRYSPTCVPVPTPSNIRRHPRVYLTQASPKKVPIMNHKGIHRRLSDSVFEV
jgi:hypothetical protein